MSLSEASPVKTCRSPDAAPDLPGSVQDYTGNWCEPFAWYDRATQSSRTWQHFCHPEERKQGPLSDAYVAGLLDGEGCLTVVQSTNKRSISPRIDVGMSIKAIELLTMLKDQFGGSLHSVREKTAHWEAATKWSLQGPSSASLLRQVGAHLVLKKEQASLLILLSEIVSTMPMTPNKLGRIWTSEALAQAAQIKAKIHLLNAKGPNVQPVHHVGGVWRTWQRSLIDQTGWEPFSGTWPRAGLILNGIAYRRAPSAPLTSATGSTLLPTPRASPNENRQTKATPSQIAGKHGWSMGAYLTHFGLPDLLPTPQARDYFPPHSLDYIAAKKAQGHGMSNLNDTLHHRKLPEMLPTLRANKWGLPDSHGSIEAWKANGLIPTPRATDADKGGRGDLLTVLRGYESAHAGTLPTPTARDWRSGMASDETHSKNSRPLNETLVKMAGNRSGRMNPRFREWMMGYPTGWTELRPPATPSSRKSRK